EAHLRPLRVLWPGRLAGQGRAGPAERGVRPQRGAEPRVEDVGVSLKSRSLKLSYCFLDVAAQADLELHSDLFGAGNGRRRQARLLLQVRLLSLVSRALAEQRAQCPCLRFLEDHLLGFLISDLKIRLSVLPYCDVIRISGAELIHHFLCPLHGIKEGISCVCVCTRME